jgi:AcrR family transcriptional regulator
MPRTYDMTKRARQASETRDRIVATTESLLSGQPIQDVTLQAIAEGAGVTVQTVLRHLGSRDGCMEAVGARVRARVDRQRGRAPSGDVDAALAGLLDHYEAEGQLVLNLLSQEAADPVMERAVAEGRAYHRSWVEHSFRPLLSSPGEEELDALVAATDIYVWKLLRLDLGRSEAATRRVVARLVHSVLEAP